MQSSSTRFLPVLAVAVAMAAGCSVVTGFGDFVFVEGGDGDGDADGDVDGDADGDADADEVIEPDGGPPPSASCENGFWCVLECDYPDDTCLDRCSAPLCPVAREALFLLWGCVDTHCPGPCIRGEGDCIACMTNHCADHFLACESATCDEGRTDPPGE